MSELTIRLFSGEQVAVLDSAVPLVLLEFADLITAFAALGTLAVAFYQLRRIARDQHATAKITEAQFLFDLDKLYEGGSFDSARRIFGVLRDTCWEEACRHHAEEDVATGGSKRSTYTFLFSACVARMWNKQETKPAYQDLIKFIGFFESMGLYVNEGLVSRQLIFKLYNSLIWQVYELMRAHIMARRHHSSLKNPDYMKNFETLALAAYTDLYGKDLPDERTPAWTDQSTYDYDAFCQDNASTIREILERLPTSPI